MYFLTYGPAGIRVCSSVDTRRAEPSSIINIHVTYLLGSFVDVLSCSGPRVISSCLVEFSDLPITPPIYHGRAIYRLTLSTRRIQHSSPFYIKDSVPSWLSNLQVLIHHQRPLYYHWTDIRPYI